MKPTKHDLNWALVAEAIRGRTYERLSSDAQTALLDETWRETDAYGAVGLLPAQGWDWSGIRDSSRPAIARIAAVAKRVLKKHGVVIPRKQLVAKATANLALRAALQAELVELRKLGHHDTPSGPEQPLGRAKGSR